LHEFLRWPYRIVLYGMCYLFWLMASLLILAYVPALTSIEAVNLLPAGWLLIAGVFFADLYFTQLKKKRS
jgi:hypothetical protein